MCVPKGVKIGPTFCQPDQVQVSQGVRETVRFFPRQKQRDIEIERQTEIQKFGEIGRVEFCDMCP